MYYVSYLSYVSQFGQLVCKLISVRLILSNDFMKEWSIAKTYAIKTNNLILILREYEIAIFRKVRHGFGDFQQNANKVDFILESGYSETFCSKFNIIIFINIYFMQNEKVDI